MTSITLLSSPNTCFHFYKFLATLKDKILDVLTFDLFYQKKLLEIEQATFSSKFGLFTLNSNSLYYRSLH